MFTNIPCVVSCLQSVGLLKDLSLVNFVRLRRKTGELWFALKLFFAKVDFCISFICPGTQVFGTASVVVSRLRNSSFDPLTSLPFPVGGHWSAVAVFEGPSLLVCLFLFWNGLFAEFFFAVVRPGISRRNSRLMWTLRSTTILFTDWGHMPDYFISDIP